MEISNDECDLLMGKHLKIYTVAGKWLSKNHSEA
jgi:hypothetical protein